MRTYLTRSGAAVSMSPADYIVQGHRPKTIYLIERVVEFAEEQDRPFTRTECWRACYGHYSAVSQTLRSMINAGLLVVLDSDRSPQMLISVDKASKWE